jgi:hypothetical protein
MTKVILLAGGKGYKLNNTIDSEKPKGLCL